MQKKTEFESLDQIFETLNEKDVKYLVMRGFEHDFDDVKNEGAHKDIDMLCENSLKVRDALGALPNRKKEDYTHYHVFVGGQIVDIDMRHVGDGYYCEEWQRNMLTNRKKWKTFYVMDDENYLYSLIYHATIQKVKFADDYRELLKEMAIRQGVVIGGESNREDFIRVLEQYMQEKGYKYVYTEDPSIPLQTKLISNNMLVHDNKLLNKRRLFIIKRTLRNVIYRPLVKVKNYIKF